MKKIANYIFLISLFLYCGASGDEIAKDPFLKPYIAELKKTTDKDEIIRLTAMDESELILLHNGFGTGIRNKWLHGDRDPDLLKFFRAKKIEDLDEMSMVMIQALWEDLNSNLTAEQLEEFTVKRAVVTRKRMSFVALESECVAQLTEVEAKIDGLYKQYGRPSTNELLRQPFSELIVSKNGKVKEIVFYEGASDELKASLTKILEAFVFTPFVDQEILTLYIIDYPSFCRVAERDTLHNKEK